MDFLIQNQTTILLALQTVCWVIAMLTAFTRNLSRRRKRAVLLLEVSSTLLLVSNVVFLAYDGDPSAAGWWAVRLSRFGLFFFTFAVLLSFNLYVESLFSDDGAAPPVLLRIAAALILAGVAILIVSQFTGFSYAFDESNVYQRRTGRTLSYILTFATLILQMLSICRARNHAGHKIRVPLLLFTLIPFVAAALQFGYHGLSLVNMVIVSMAIVLFVFTIQDMNEQVENAHRLEIEMHEKYQRELERTVDERTRELRVANEKAEALLLNILPADIARELTEHPGRTISRKYGGATVLFTDIVGFTKMSGGMTAEEVVTMLNRLFSKFDERAQREGIEKIKTIGDAYMAATGLAEDGAESGTPTKSDAARAAAAKMVRFAQGLLADVRAFNGQSAVQVQIRVGINTGELVAGVIGKSKFIYDIWGDTVNVASRMESTGEPMRIHVNLLTRGMWEKR